MGEIFKLFGSIGVDTSDAEKGIDSVTGKAQKSGKSIFGAFVDAAKGIGKIAAGIGVFKLIDSAINMVRGSIQSAFGRIDTMEQFERVMTTMLGSADKANKVLDKTSDIVTGTAYGLDTAANSVQRFVTSSVDVNKATGYVESFGNAVAFYGDGSDETFARVNAAMAEMASSGKASLGAVRTLTESTIPVFEIYGEAVGKSGAQVQKELESGKISANDFLDTLTKAFDEGTESFPSLANAAREAGGSWRNTFGNMRAAVTRGTIAIIDSIDNMLKSNGLPDMRNMIATFGKVFEDALKKAAGVVGPLIGVLIDLGVQVKDSTAWRTLKELVISVKDGFSDLWGKLQESGILETVWGYVTQLWDALLEIDFVKLTQDIGAFIDKWSPLIAGIAGGITAFKLITGAMALWAGAIGLWTTVTTIATGVGTAFATVIAFITSPIGIVVIAIGALIAIGVLLWKNWDTIKAKTIEIWGFVVDAIFNFLGKVEQVFTNVMDKVLNILSTAWNFIYDLWTSVLSRLMDNTSESFQKVLYHIQMALESIWIIIETYWNYVKETFLNVLAFLKALITGDFGVMKDMVREQLILMKETISTLWQQVKAVFENVVGAIKEFVIGKFQEVKAKLSEIWEGITETVSTVWEFIKNVITVGIMFISELFKAAFQLLTLPFMFIWENIKEYVFAVWEWIKKIITTAFTAVSKIVLAILGVILGYFKDKWDQAKKIVETVFTAISKFTSTIWNAIRSFLTTIISTIVKWVTDRFNALKNNITTIFNAIKNVVSAVWNGIKSIISSVVNAILSVITSVFNTIRNTVSSIFNVIKNIASTVWNGIKNTVSSAVNGIKSIVSSVFNALKSTVTTVWNSIKNAIMTPIKAAQNAVKIAIDKIKSYFNFKWSFPKLKMPHFSVQGKFSLAPPSVPKLGIEWYKDGGIMEKAMAFGMNGNNVMVGGEAGREAILPLNKETLGGIGDGIAATMNWGNAQIVALLEEIKRTNEQVVMQIIELLSRNETVVIQIDGQTIAMVTRDHMDKELGDKTNERDFGKGRS